MQHILNTTQEENRHYILGLEEKVTKRDMIIKDLKKCNKILERKVTLRNKIIKEMKKLLEN